MSYGVNDISIAAQVQVSISAAPEGTVAICQQPSEPRSRDLAAALIHGAPICHALTGLAWSQLCM